ncbi:MAG: hypothetical protein ACJZ5P_04775 [Candidatus Thalassarchaeaceae archaeon]
MTDLSGAGIGLYPPMCLCSMLFLCQVDTQAYALVFKIVSMRRYHPTWRNQIENPTSIDM